MPDGRNEEAFFVSCTETRCIIFDCFRETGASPLGLSK